MPSVPSPCAVKNVLCVRTDRLGEFLLTLPAVQLIKQNFPKARVSLACLRQNADLVQGMSCVDELIAMDAVGSFGTALRIMREKPFDIVVVFNPLKYFHAAAFLSRIPVRVGYNRKWGFLLNMKKEDAKYLGLYHEIEYNVQLASLVCAERSVPEIVFPWEGPQEAEDCLFQAGIRRDIPLVVMHPFSSDRSKEIPFSFWQALVGSIGKKGQGVVFIGLAEEYQRSDFRRFLGDRCWSLCGKASLRQIALLLRHRAHFYVGVDSGPFHIASFLRRPLAVLFRKEESIKRWGPYGHGRGRAYLYQPELSEKLIEDIVRAIP